MRNLKLVSDVLQGISHQLRITIVESLEASPRTFSDLMVSCGLNPNFDSGFFYYHLSGLIGRRIVEKDGEAYRLTEFGCAVLKVLKALGSEWSISMEGRMEVPSPAGKREVKELEGLTTRWGSAEDLEKHKDSVSFVFNEDSVPAENRLKVKRFKGWTERMPPFYMAEKDGKEVGKLHLDKRQDIVEVIKMEEGRALARHKSTIHLVGAFTFEEDRQTVIETMLDGFLEEAKDNGAEVIRAEVDVEDQAYLNALERSGFEKLGTVHRMQKEIK